MIWRPEETCNCSVSSERPSANAAVRNLQGVYNLQTITVSSNYTRYK